MSADAAPFAGASPSWHSASVGSDRPVFCVPIRTRTVGAHGGSLKTVRKEMGMTEREEHLGTEPVAEPA